jgi:hypothetical protein
MVKVSAQEKIQFPDGLVGKASLNLPNKLDETSSGN